MDDTGVPPTGSGRSAEPEPSCTVSAVPASVPNAVMDDASLAAFLNVTAEEAAIIIPKLTPAKRATIGRMASVVADLNMSVIPDGVIVCKPRCRR